MERVTEMKVDVGHGPRACNTDISVVTVEFWKESDYKVSFIDVPDFENVEQLDAKMWEILENWLIKTYVSIY